MRTSRRYREPFQFTWRIPECGFRFEVCTDNERKIRCLVHAADVSRHKMYRPLESHTALFQQFANLELDEKAVIKFANEFGWLGGAVAGWFVDDRNRRICAEPLESWLREIADMHRLLGFWEQLRNEDEDAAASYLRKRLKFSPEAVTIQFGDSRDTVAFRHDHDFAGLQPDDPLQVGWTYLGRNLNDKLQRYPLNTRMMHDRGKDRELTLFIRPSSLVAALWFQLARAVEGNRHYRRCALPGCKVLFEVGGRDAKRADSKFCTPSHRAANAKPAKAKSSRRRKRHA